MPINIRQPWCFSLFLGICLMLAVATNAAASPTIVDFDNPVSGGYVNGLFQGINFGTNQRSFSGPYSPDPTNSVWMEASPRSFTFSPAPRVLLSLSVGTTAAGTLTLTDNLGQTKTQVISLGSMQTVATNWTQASTTVTISFTSGPHLVVGTITYTDELLAFPGAEGFGRFAKGGRGGAVLQVTNLNDSGPGSLRACVEASGPRTCVFRVSGTIELQNDIVTRNPYLTIAGQTAPGGGITLKNFGLFVGGDSIIRYIRIRPGLKYKSKQNINCIWVSQNSIVDHCSFSWGTDDLVLLWGEDKREITFQWCVFSEGLAKGLAGEDTANLGFLIGSGADKVSIHHNLFAHVRQRTPAIEASGDVVNNIVYNYWREPQTLITYYRPGYTNIVGNYYKYGPNTDPTGYEIRLMGGYETTKDSSAYLKDNVVDKTGRVEPALVQQDDGGVIERRSRHSFSQVATKSALQAYTDVLAGAGCSKPARDRVDLRIISEVQNRTGRWISHPSDVGGWPVLAPGTAPADSDGDGMPNYWEDANKLNKNDPTDRNSDADGDGYTNLEEYLNGTKPRVP